MSAGFYERMRATAKRLLAPTDEGGLGQGTIALVRYEAAAAPATPWDPPAPPTRKVTPLDGVARGVSAQLVGTPVDNGGQVIATDLQVVVAPWGGEYGPADIIEIDGAPVTVLKVENIPAAGLVCAIRFLMRQ